MQQEILFDRKFNFAGGAEQPAPGLYLLLGYQDEQLTFAAERLHYRPPGGARFQPAAFRRQGFGDGAELLECIAAARPMLVGGLYVCGLLLASLRADDLGLLEEKAGQLGQALTEAEELSSPELLLVGCAEGRARFALLNKSSLALSALKHPVFEDFARRVGRLHFLLDGSYFTAEAADLRDQSAFLGEVSVAVRQDLLAADYLVDGRRLTPAGVPGQLACAQAIKLHSSDGAAQRLLASAAREERAGVRVHMALFCYYSFRCRMEEVVGHLCQDFDRSLLARAALAAGNLHLPVRLLVVAGGLGYNCYAGAAEHIAEAAQAVRRWLTAEGAVEVLDYEKIDEFRCQPAGFPHAADRPGPGRPEELSRRLPQLLTALLAVLLAFLLKKLLLH